MVNVNKMQKKIDKLLSVFTGLIDALNSSISELNKAIDDNNATIEQAKADNIAYNEKIKEYETLKSNVANIIS